MLAPRRAHVPRWRWARRPVRATGARSPIAACSSVPSSSNANSSPPSRASVSAGRVTMAKRLRNLLQELVAGAVAEGVVDLLEAIEVDEQHRENLLGSRGASERLVEPVTKECAVRKVGEPVVERLARQLLLEPHALGDVTCIEHDAADISLARRSVTCASRWRHSPNLFRTRNTISCGSPFPNAASTNAWSPASTKRVKPSPRTSFSVASQHVEHRLARVAALAVAEDEHEVCGGRYRGCGSAPSAASLRRSAPRRAAGR